LHLSQARVFGIVQGSHAISKVYGGRPHLCWPAQTAPPNVFER
jgi:hypothetical protein